MHGSHSSEHVLAVATAWLARWSLKVTLCDATAPALVALNISSSNFFHYRFLSVLDVMYCTTSESLNGDVRRLDVSVKQEDVIRPSKRLT